jgi:hypothetical protein
MLRRLDVSDVSCGPIRAEMLELWDLQLAFSKARAIVLSSAPVRAIGPASGDAVPPPTAGVTIWSAGFARASRADGMVGAARAVAARRMVVRTERCLD